jgi:hypothetical protein
MVDENKSEGERFAGETESPIFFLLRGNGVTQTE